MLTRNTRYTFSLPLLLVLVVQLAQSLLLQPLPAYAEILSDTPSLTILTPHEHPPRGTDWTIQFRTTGTDTLIIAPLDAATRADITDPRITCGDETRTPTVIDTSVLVFPQWHCTQTATLRYRILTEGNHTLRFRFAESTEDAHNSTGTFQFAKRLGGISYDTGYAITTDSSDNIIVAGSVNGNADLNGDGDSTDGGAEDATGYGGYDIVFSVFDSTGTFQFAKRLGGISYDTGYAITTDSSDNIIVAGSVTGNADLNGDGDSTDGGAEDATGYGNNDIVFSVFDSTGTFQFAKRLGGTSFDSAYSVTTDSSDNIIVAGSVTGNADLNGDGDSTDGGAEDATGYGNTDIVFSVFDSAGTFQFAKRLGGTSTDYGYAITTDSSDNIIVAGYVNGNADLNGDGDSTDGGAEDATGYGNTDIVFSVFDSTGTFQFAKRLGGISYDTGYAITTDSSDNIIVAGYVNGNADLNGDGDSTDGGAEDATGYGNTDIVFSVFDSAGTFQFAKRLGGTSSDIGYSVTTDSSDNIIVAGLVRGNADLNGDGDSTDGGTEDATEYAGTDIFFSVFDSTGSWQLAKRLGGVGNGPGEDDYAQSIVADSNNRIVVAGLVYQNADLNGDGDSTDGGAEDATGYGSTDIIFSVFSIVSDTTAPTIQTLSPADNATDIATTANLVLTFDEAVDAESGNITIKKTSDNSTIEAIDVTSGQVTGGGTTTITVNPSVTLDDATSYYVQIDATAFDDTAGNSFAGIATTTTWNFTTADETAPTIQTLSPADNATDISTTTNLVLTFDEGIGTSGTGTVRIYRSSDDALIEQIAVTGPLVTGSGTTQITINPDTTFTAGTAYYIHISADAFPDAAGNFFAGISDGTTWNFVIADSVVRQSESSSTTILQTSGGRRGSLEGMQRRIMQAFQAMRHGRRSTAPAEQENAVSAFQVRVCARVHRRAFAEHVLERVNTRLLQLFGFTCAP